jgi:ribosomal protein L33
MKKMFKYDGWNYISGCDCTVAIVNPRFKSEEATISTLSYELCQLSKYLTTKEKLDSRRGWIKKYTHCPECKQKINWKEIKESLV